MAEVWKFPLVPGREWMEMPKGSELLYVGVQQGEPFLWAKVDPYADLRRRHVVIYGTGHHIDGWPDYVGSFMLDSGALVFHVFATSSEMPCIASQADAS